MIIYLNTVYRAVTPHAFALINPFSSKEKTTAIITALASKYLFNISYTYSCLIGLLTFGCLKIYQLKKNKEDLINAQTIKKFLNYDKDYLKKVLESNNGDLFNEKKQFILAIEYFYPDFFKYFTHNYLLNFLDKHPTYDERLRSLQKYLPIN